MALFFQTFLLGDILDKPLQYLVSRRIAYQTRHTPRPYHLSILAPQRVLVGVLPLLVQLSQQIGPVSRIDVDIADLEPSLLLGSIPEQLFDIGVLIENPSVRCVARQPQGQFFHELPVPLLALSQGFKALPSTEPFGKHPDQSLEILHVILGKGLGLLVVDSHGAVRIRDIEHRTHRAAEILADRRTFPMGVFHPHVPAIDWLPPAPHVEDRARRRRVHLFEIPCTFRPVAGPRFHIELFAFLLHHVDRTPLDRHSQHHQTVAQRGDDLLDVVLPIHPPHLFPHAVQRSLPPFLALQSPVGGLQLSGAFRHPPGQLFPGFLQHPRRPLALGDVARHALGVQKITGPGHGRGVDPFGIDQQSRFVIVVGGPQLERHRLLAGRQQAEFEQARAPLSGAPLVDAIGRLAAVFGMDQLEYTRADQFVGLVPVIPDRLIDEDDPAIGVQPVYHIGHRPYDRPQHEI